MHNNGVGRKPILSIIIPAFNTADTISGCLDSVFSQSYGDFEAIVINDGSPDTPHLEEVLQPYLSRIIYVKQENKRAAGARNTAIRRARGEFLAFLDSDDTWLPDHLATQMALFEQDPTIDLVYANALIVGAKYQQEFMKRCPSEGPVTFPALVVERCQIPISTVVVRKSVIVKAGFFDESLQRCDDYDMWLRTIFQGAKVTYTRRVQAHLNSERPGSLGQVYGFVHEAPRGRRAAVVRGRASSSRLRVSCPAPLPAEGRARRRATPPRRPEVQPPGQVDCVRPFRRASGGGFRRTRRS